MSVLDGFELVVMKEDLHITVFKGGLLIGANTWRKLGKPATVNLLIDRTQRMLAIVRGDQHEVDTRSKKILSVDVRKECERMMGTEVGNKSIRINGEWFGEEEAILYKLNNWELEAREGV